MKTLEKTRPNPTNPKYQSYHGQHGIIKYDVITVPVICSKINPLRPSDARVLELIRSSLVSVITSHLIDTKPLLEPMLIYCELSTQAQNPQENFKKYFFFQAIVFENVLSKMCSIPSRRLCVDAAVPLISPH